MTTRPTARWRSEIREEASALAAGTLMPEDAAAARFWGEYLLAHTDSVLDAFDAAVARLNRPTDDQVMAAVKDVVVGLNQVQADLRNRHETPYETGEREALAGYIIETLEEAGIDLGALGARRGIDRTEITDEWRREW